MKLLRPHIPLSVKLDVAGRQLMMGGLWLPSEHTQTKSKADMLAQRLKALATLYSCEVKDLRLDHDPALGTRSFNKRTGKYIPDANDPACLTYREKTDHDTKTWKRGEHGQYSDIVLIKRERRRKRKAATKTTQKKQRQLRAAVLGLKVKRKIPSRPFPKRVRGK